MKTKLYIIVSLSACMALAAYLFCSYLWRLNELQQTTKEPAAYEPIPEEVTSAPIATQAPTPTEAPKPTPTSAPAATPTAAPTPTPTEAPEPTLDPEEVELIGRTIWGEAEVVKSKAERAAVAWCILNRVDSRGQTIKEVVTAPRQFHGYRPAEKWGECPQKHLDLAADVLARWYAEKEGSEDVGRVLPAEYTFFVGDGERNHFATKWQGTDFWDWSLPDPYTTTQ